MAQYTEKIFLLKVLLLWFILKFFLKNVRFYSVTLCIILACFCDKPVYFFRYSSTGQNLKLLRAITRLCRVRILLFFNLSVHFYFLKTNPCTSRFVFMF